MRMRRCINTYTQTGLGPLACSHRAHMSQGSSIGPSTGAPASLQRKLFAWLPSVALHSCIALRRTTAPDDVQKSVVRLRTPHRWAYVNQCVCKLITHTVASRCAIVDTNQSAKELSSLAGWVQLLRASLYARGLSPRITLTV